MKSKLIRVLKENIKLLFLRVKIKFHRAHQVLEYMIGFSNSKRSIYKFTRRDIDLYVSERNLVLPNLSIVDKLDLNLREVTINNTKIYWPDALSPNDLPWLYHEVFDGFNHNPSSYDHPHLSISEKTWIIDAGAAEGFFSVFVASSTTKETRILAIEPFELMKSALLKTFEQFPEHDFTVIQAALGNEDKLVAFDINESHVCDSKVQDNLISEIDPEKLVQQLTIDSLAKDLSLSAGGLIKMDIEGYEMLALMGATETMKSFKPALAVAVYHDYENAIKCAQIIKDSNPTYHIEFRGYYGYFKPPRPYMLFAY
jgi:FkbM family methyltransferase